MAMPSGINIEDYTYVLPADRIAQRPTGVRDESRLLVYRDGLIRDKRFSEIDTLIPENSLLVFNDTKVIRARLMFAQTGGSLVEIFCLEPIAPSADFQVAFQQQSACRWSCLVGNNKKWKNGNLVKPMGPAGSWLKAERIKSLDYGCFEIEFSWAPAVLPFSEILMAAGQVPLPPYIHRISDNEDALRYQTVYARHEGSVAAPTAGLHFTREILERIRARNCQEETVTLHVGLGTFKPVTVSDIRQHSMHRETFSVKLSTLGILRKSFNGPVTAVGTTSARTLESLYWLGVKAIANPQSEINNLNQWDPYDSESTGLPSATEAIDALISHVNQAGLDEFQGSTSLIIVPGYTFRIINSLITNFHMPRSTLLLLIAAFTGNGWQEAYAYALEHDYRFLSYGDACMFLQK